MKQKLQKRDLRKHFEAIIGHGIGDAEENILALRERIGLWSLLDNSHITSREIGTTGYSTKACSSMSVFSIGGLTVTGADGKAEFLLSEHHCFFANEFPDRSQPTFPIIFVATAQSQEPVFVTARTSAIFNGNVFTDVKVEIYTWDSGGNPAKVKLVDWFCQLPFFGVVG